MKRILSVTIHREIDSDPDTRYLGEYSDKPVEGAIDRQERGDCGRNEYRYFVSTNHSPHNPKDWANVSDTIVDKALRHEQNSKTLAEIFPTYLSPIHSRDSKIRMLDRAYAEQDYRRMERLNAGDWCYLGIYVTAQIQLESDVIQTIRSGGLWGIESDSDASYLTETEDAELEQLRAELFAIGFSPSEISEAFGRAERKDI